MARSPDDVPPVDEESLSDERLPLTDLESIGNRPPSRRKRVTQTALLALAVCVALALVWSTIAPGKQQTTQPNTTLTPTRMLLVSNLPNATITLNGKKLSGALPQVVTAYLERDDITIAAPLFRPHTCHFVQLKAIGDNTHCLFTSSGALNGPALALGIFLTPADLLPGQQQQALAPIMQQLATAWQATVSPGDYLATAFDNALGAITSQRATTALQASASFVQAGSLSAPAPPFPYELTPACAQLLCPTGSGLAGAGTTQAAGPVWNLLLNVALRWRFSDEAGATIADVTYQPVPSEAFWPTSLLVQLVYAAGGWHLAASTDLSQAMQAVICSNGTAILEKRLSPGSWGSMEPGSNRGARGCLISVQGTAKGNGTFLWRFGVLLAANAGAHAILPDLPLAPKAAIAAAS